jgi:nicotinamide-nucleotide amidase
MTNNSISLAQKLGDILLHKAWQVTCAESCTGGGIGYAITSISGSSSWFKQGYITYSNDAKHQLLSVSTNTLQQFGAVSVQTVKEMAVGAARNASANCAMSVSGIAGPDGGSAEKPVGTVWFGFAVEQKVFAELKYFHGDRQHIRNQAVDFALLKMCELLKE